jgi:hypothetical protein
MAEHLAPNVPDVPADGATSEVTPSEGASRERSWAWLLPWNWLAKWWANLKAGWAAGGPLTKVQRRGFIFWLPVGLVFGAVELAGALSGAFRNFIPWPTFSTTIGHIEDAASWVGVIVVGVIAMVAYRAATNDSEEARTPHGRVIPPTVSNANIKTIDLKVPIQAFSYDWPFVFTATALVTLAVNRLWSDEKLVLGYSIYGSLLVFGVVIPSLLVRFALDARFPSVWIPVAVLRKRFPATPYLLVGGLAILIIHLALYPWPDITRESTSYAGLSARAAQSKAVKRIRDLRADMPALRYSTQTRGVADGKDAWLVFFTPANGSGAAPYSGCVVAATHDDVSPSAECSK